MSINCKLGFHSWNIDKCTQCGKERQRGTFLDERDAQVYKWIKIGGQVWMAENIKYKTNGGCWAFDNNNAYAKHYGYLYDWETALKVQPKGWHLPTQNEWKVLVDHLGGEQLAARKMMVFYHYHGVASDEHLTNMSGFSALMGGRRHKDGEFYGIKSCGEFWSSTPYGGIGAWFCQLFDGESDVHVFTKTKVHGLSVRCIKDN